MPFGQTPTGALNVVDPRGSHTYFKLPLDDQTERFLLCESESLRLPLVGDRLSFSGQWLARHYRRERQRWTVRDEEGLSSFVSWPSVFFPHSDELASPVRFQARLEWYRGDGKRFEPPDQRARRMKTKFKPPTEIMIRRVIDDDGSLLPYALDDRLFLNQLGVSDEELADLYDVLRTHPSMSPSRMLDLVCSCLESKDGWVVPESQEAEVQHDGLYKRLCTAVGQRLQSSSRAPRMYPVGFVHEGHTIQTTHHLQRDLALTIHRMRTGKALDPREPLTGYLSGRADRAGLPSSDSSLRHR